MAKKKAIRKPKGWRKFDELTKKLIEVPKEERPRPQRAETQAPQEKEERGIALTDEIYIGGSVITKSGTRFDDVREEPNSPIPDYYSGIVRDADHWNNGQYMGFTRSQVVSAKPRKAGADQ